MTDIAADSPPPSKKLDPEAFALRGRPRAAVRFKRWLVVALAAGGAVILVLTAWFALKPRIFHIVPSDDQQSQPMSNAPSDTLAKLPSSYGDVPSLGPPLPGDLGKPVLDQQQQSLTRGQLGTAERYAQAIAAERQRQQAELKAARESGVIFQSGGREDQGSERSTVPVDAKPDALQGGEKIAFDPDRDPNGQQRKVDFARAVGVDGDENPHRLTPPASPYVLTAGTMISASLITGLKSDVPGMVTAQVTEDVFDSPTGKVLLVPQGARLIGTYDSVVAFGQSRALIVWQRLILPDGNSLRIDNAPATDAGGYAGLSDQVDRHTWQLLKGVALSTMLGVGTQLQFSGRGGLVEAIRQSSVQNVSRAGDQLTAKAVNIQPTITIRPGTPVQLMVQKDLILAPWRG